MKRIFLLLILLAPLISTAQSGPGISFSRNHFPVFHLDEDRFPGTAAYTIALSYHDQDYTQLEFSVHHSRGYDRSVSYSYGLSAGYVASLSETVSLKAGLGADVYRMRDRECKSFIRGVMILLFDADDDCADDHHASLNPFIAAEVQVAEPLSLFLQTSFRGMISNTRETEGTRTETTPDGGQVTYDIIETKNSSYAAGVGLAIGIKLHLY